MPEVQDIFLRYGTQYCKTHELTYTQEKAFKDICDCRRSERFGARVEVCDYCGNKVITYGSCRNRNCPKCQAFASRQWVENEKQYLMNTSYFHVVFTIPAELYPVMMHYQSKGYNLMFQAMSETLLELCADPKYLGATPGITAVLHTWGQTLVYHPHIHCIVTGGGLKYVGPRGEWVASGKKFFLPVRIMSALFRGKLLALLKENEIEFDHRLYEKDWVVYCKKPFKTPDIVLRYLSNYTHKVAISNSRIINIDDGKVTFRYKDYNDGNKQKVMTLSAFEFIRRFMLHVVNYRFHKIRHYGILSSRDKQARVTLCQKLTNLPKRMLKKETDMELLQEIFHGKFGICPCCGMGHLCPAMLTDEDLGPPLNAGEERKTSAT